MQAAYRVRAPVADNDSSPANCVVATRGYISMGSRFPARCTSAHRSWEAHRAHAIVEQVIADLKSGPLAHLPSGQFCANSAWLVCAAMAFNLTRTAGTLASTVHAKATTGTIRAQPITIPGRLARSARRLTLHLPTGWPWQKAWHQLATAANSPPLAA